MSHYDKELIGHEDFDELVEHTKGLLIDAEYDGRKSIHPAFFDWLMYELTDTGVKPNNACTLIQVAIQETILARDIREIEELETARGE